MYLFFDLEKEARHQHRRVKEATHSGNAVQKDATVDDRPDVLCKVN